MKCFRIGLSVVLLAFAWANPGWSGEILIVADEWEQMDRLGGYLHDQGGHEISKMEQGDLPESLHKYDAVIQFVHGMLNNVPAAKLMDYTNNGGRLLVLHHGVSSAKKKTQGWYEFLGVELDRSEEAKHYYEWIHGVDYKVVNLNPTHYVTSHNVTYPTTQRYASSDFPSVMREYPALEFKHSEVFLNHQFTDGREKTVLFGFYFEHPQSGKVSMQDRAGWYKPQGEGIVFYFQPGHLVDDFNQQYNQILLNAIEWED